MAICFAAFGLICATHDPMAVNNLALHDVGAAARADVSISHDVDNDWFPWGYLVPNMLGGLVFAVLCNVYPRPQLLGGLAILASLSSFIAAAAGHFTGFASSRFLTGLSVGGALPLIYSLSGDWFPAAGRVTVCALISTIASGAVLLGQSIASAFGSARWRVSFLLLAGPSLVAGFIALHAAEDPARPCKDYFLDAFRRHERAYSVVLNFIRAARAIASKRTNLVVLLQSFPANMLIGITAAGLHGFLREELHLPPARVRLGTVVVLGAATAGYVFGGCIGEAIYAIKPRHLALFAGICNVLRALPLMLLLLLARVGVPFKSEAMHLLVFMLLGLAGASMTVSSPCIGAMLLNVNPAEMRGLIGSLNAVLDEGSKGLGAFLMVLTMQHTHSMQTVPGRHGISHVVSAAGEHHSSNIPQSFGPLALCFCAAAVSMISGLVLLVARNTYEKDEADLKTQLDALMRQQTIRSTKQSAQVAVQRLARAAGEAHHAEFVLAQAAAGHAVPAPQREVQAPPIWNKRTSWQEWRASTASWLQDQHLALGVISQLR